MKKYSRPRKIVTDESRAYSAARKKEVGNADRQDVRRGLNNFHHVRPVRVM
jgi:transposase-like protein